MAVLSLLTGAAFGQGACPAAALYLSPTSPQTGGGTGSVTLASLGVTNCYYVSAAGADANTGADETHPWLHAPGMPACASTCAATTLVAGNGVIFRGGDTWHRSSGSPATGGAWTLPSSGTSANPIYWGFDFGWFSGGSFARPIFNQDNPLSTSTVGSCLFADDGTTFLNPASTSFNIVDAFEFTGHCNSGSGVSSIINPISATSFTTERLYIHGWTSTAGVGDDAGVAIGNNSNSTSNTSNRHLFDVIDGADSTFGASCNATSCLGTGHASGWAFGDAYDVEYSVIRHVSNGIQAGNICTLIGNLMEYEFEPSLPGGRHGNVVEANFGNACQGFSHNMLAYNNVTRNTNTGVNWWLLGGTYYIFNNIWINSGHLFGSPPIDPNGLMLSGLGTTGFSTVHANLYNNTFQSNKVQVPVESGTTPGWGAGSTITWENNHIMDFTSTPSFFTCGAGNTCTATENGGEVFQTTAAANTQGYNFANTWAPTAASNATVGLGLNATTFCTGLPNSAATSACGSGTSQAVTEVAAWGGQIAQYPAITPNSRTAWDAGAYQFLPPVVICPSPYQNARCDLSTAPLPTVPPQMGPHVCTAGLLQSCGNLTGAGTIVTDPAFGAKIMRGTQTGFDPAHPNFSMSVTASGSGEDQRWNPSSTMLLVSDTGGRDFPTNFSFGAPLAPMFPTNPTYSANGGFFINTTVFFAHNWTTPNYLYNLGNGQGGAAGATGTILGHWDLTNQVTLQNFVQDFDFSSSANCLGGGFTPTWSTNGGSDQFDNDFAFGFSNTGGQGTGIYVAVWERGKGCRVLNISTGIVTGDWGPTGPITGTTCFGGIFLHNVKIYKQAGALWYDFSGTPPAQCSDTGSGNVYVWQYTGVNVTPQCPTGSQCSGHLTEGKYTSVNNVGNAVPFYWAARGVQNLSTPIGIVPSLPSAGTPGTMDWHVGWNQLNDLTPFIGTTYMPNGEPIVTGWQDEVIGMSAQGNQNPIRFAHTFNLMTGSVNDFSTWIALGSVSQDGRWYAFTSNWMDTLGNTNGTATCIPEGPKWKASTSYGPSGVIYTTPTVSNAGKYTFQPTTPGTSGTVQPIWPQTIGNTITDGSVTWTNIGQSSTAYCRGDVFILPLIPLATVHNSGVSF